MFFYTLCVFCLKWVMTGILGGCDVVSELLLVVISGDVIVTNSIITNPRIVIMVVLHAPTSLHSH